VGVDQYIRVSLRFMYNLNASRLNARRAGVFIYGSDLNHVSTSFLA
jgi:hypothetical protein